MALQFDQVIEGVCAAQLAGVDQAHEQIADLGTVQGAIKQGILSMENGALQGSFYEVIVQRGPGDGDIVPLLVKMLKTLAGWYLGFASAEHSCDLPSP
jgi:hypothetical protein